MEHRYAWTDVAVRQIPNDTAPSMLTLGEGQMALVATSDSTGWLAVFASDTVLQPTGWVRDTAMHADSISPERLSERISALRPLFDVSTDEFTGEVTYKPAGGVNGIKRGYLILPVISIKDHHPRMLLFAATVSTFGDGWLFWDHFIFKADGELIQPLVEADVVERKITDSGLLEGAQFTIDELMLSELRTVATAANVKVRFDGQRNLDLALTKADQKRLHDAIALYELLKRKGS